jgi:hypothetical protein
VKLVALPIYKNEVDKNIVEKLEDLLEQAKKGELAGLAYAIIETDGSISTSHSKTTDFPRLAGGVAILFHKVMEERPKA